MNTKNEPATRHPTQGFPRRLWRFGSRFLGDPLRRQWERPPGRRGAGYPRRRHLLKRGRSDGRAIGVKGGRCRAVTLAVN